MKQLFSIRCLILLLSISILSCGGGGSDDDVPVNVPDNGKDPPAVTVITGTWYIGFSSPKGEGYCILTFNQNGTGKYQEYDKTNGKLEYYEESFLHTYDGGKLLFLWSDGDSETADVIVYSTDYLILKDWPDHGTNTFLPLTDEVLKQIEEMQSQVAEAIRILSSDSGSKKWKWDTSITGVVWGDMGYCGGHGEDVALIGNGQWWGVSSEAEFMDQLQHTHDGKYHGDGDVEKSYMDFTIDGVVTSYDANGRVIRTGTYTVSDYDASGEWRKGFLNTDAILWPYEINSGGNIPGKYEIVYLSADKLCLVYPDNGDFGGLGNWGEATFWHFCSNSDVKGMIAGYGNGKDWTWDYDGSNTIWGNMGYCGGSGADVGINRNGQWWGVTSESDFMEQLHQTNDGTTHGDESMNAFMTFGTDGTIVRHAGNGSIINSGTYDTDASVANEWKMANLNTTAGTILWPYEINSGGNMPTTFEVVYLTGGKMCLVYPDNGDFGGLGNWGEATYWRFKAK